jgi:hypothetical protein
MRYDDPQRPVSIAADSAPLQVSGSPLPVVTLIRPMESEQVAWACSGTPGSCNGARDDTCPGCHESRPTTWGWLACIHAHREGSRFGYHTAWIADLGEFTQAYLADPEAALAKWFKYHGPEARKPIPREVAPDLWEA